MKKILIISLITLIALSSISLIVLAIKYPVVFHYYTVNFSTLKKVDRNVFVESTVSQEQIDVLLKSIKEGTKRIATLYGSTDSDPIIIAGLSSGFYKDYGLVNDAGINARTPISSFIVFGRNGINNTDIIAHEICHSELYHRLGWTSIKKLPLWFDEGIATQVDFRDQYSDNAWNMVTNNGENIADYKHMNIKDGSNSDMYILSRHEVKRWIGIVGKEGLLKFISNLRDGSDFEKAYKSIEESRT